MPQHHCIQSFPGTRLGLSQGGLPRHLQCSAMTPSPRHDSDAQALAPRSSAHTSRAPPAAPRNHDNQTAAKRRAERNTKRHRRHASALTPPSSSYLVWLNARCATQSRHTHTIKPVMRLRRVLTCPAHTESPPPLAQAPRTPPVHHRPSRAIVREERRCAVTSPHRSPALVSSSSQKGLPR